MPDRDAKLATPADIATALALLTRLPVPMPAGNRGARAAWAYPLAGLFVGLIAASIAGFATWLGLPPALVAGLALLALITATGALHEDGLADTADGFWGGWDRQRRLEIMKDSRIGSYGVIALILTLGLRWAALSALIDHGQLVAPILAAAIVSRAPMVVVMATLPNARDTGMSMLVGRPRAATALLATLTALALGTACLGGSVLPVALVLILATSTAALISRSKIGGQTGDVLGATQQIGEIAALVTLSVLI